MNCPECQAWSVVLLSRTPKRRRECANGHRFSTIETYQDQPVNQDFLTPSDLAERWHVEIKTLSNWRVQGKGPAYMKLGGGNNNTKVLYPLEAVLAYEQLRLELGSRRVKQRIAGLQSMINEIALDLRQVQEATQEGSQA